MGKSLMIAAAMTAIVAPGGANPEVVAAEPIPISSPEIFNECAELATAPGDNQTIGIDVPTAIVHPDKERVAFNIRDRWEGPLATAGGVACGGMIRLGNKFQLRSGNVNQKISRERIGFDAQNADGIKVGGAYNISYGRICAIARELQGKQKPKVSLIQINTRSYSEPGYPTARTTDTTLQAKLPCASIKSEESSDRSGENNTPQHPPKPPIIEE